jgi:drug/metabolite transporter (DMT)-like permease
LNLKLPTRSWLALGLAIACWTLSPLLIYKSAGLAPAPIVALFAVAIGATLGVLFLAQSAALNVKALIIANRSQRTVIKAVAIGTGTFIGYPLLYFSALQTAHSLALVNLVNYLWPVVGISLVAVSRHDELSLETVLAVGFGFAGAAIAISTAHGSTQHISNPFMPFLLAGLGALLYGAVSAFMRLLPDTTGAYHTQMLVLALFVAGLLAYLTLGVLFFAHRSLVEPHYSAQRLTAVLIYSALLPVAHLSWLTAVQDPRVPTFPAAFVIPVTSTGLLLLVIGGQTSPAVLSALVLVLCGIAFSVMSQQTVPLRFAVTLGGLASIQVSLALRDTPIGAVDDQTSLLALILVGLLAIFGGFVLTNAIQRHNTLQLCCAAFYGNVVGAKDRLSPEEATAALDCLDRFVLATGDTPTIVDPDGGGPSRPLRAGRAEPYMSLREALTMRETIPSIRGAQSVSPEVLAARTLFPEEWAKVDVALSNKVSPYEWLVLLLGSVGLILASQFFAMSSHSAATVIIRAFTVSVTAGVIFAIRDYDKHRPAQIMKTLVALRNGFNLDTPLGSPLGEAVGRSATRRIGPWEVVGLTVLILSALVAIALNIG